MHVFVMCFCIIEFKSYIMLHFSFDTIFILMVFTKYIQMFCKSKLLNIRFERLYVGMIFF
jgi:hypothetical protein